MKITILGNSGPYPRAGSACSGYLLEDEEIKILIDCGNGILSRLLGQINSLEELDTIILTHLHSDHISDIMIMRYALGINQAKGKIKKSIPLYAPQDPLETYNKIQYKDAFILNELNERTLLNIGDMRITFEEMSHPVKTFAVIVEKNNKKFVYTSDTKYCNNLAKIAKDADVLLCECNIMEEDLTEDVYHLSTKQVGELSTSLGVKKLLLTHIWPEYDLSSILNEVKTYYPGDVEIAAEFKTYEID
ncbi:MBL fold metallo-hydrolase [Maledivibacter halophilus]|uniref:Ribonuclease BN, tRNA processing enzyme n=1 Tax=Maledivibacter halophilus TaxID=36842 RepID=A0A1T5LV85_9FIRM|nr:MBL fold metallo-hydrolase [Maledivibacter halophilus]SKC79755.1 Ribonuclease BN, tRNA processing enzyme [Maledivibacter halophilus]